MTNVASDASTVRPMGTGGGGRLDGASIGDRRALARHVAVATGAVEVFDWVEEHFEGEVVHVERLDRWRPGWMIDVERSTGLVALYVRGDRNTDFPSPYSLAHEQRVHALLETHGVPVPHVYAMVPIGSSTALVMDRVPGVQGLAHAPDDAIRSRLMADWVDLMLAMHDIGADDLAAAGFPVPSSPDQIVRSGAIARLEEHYLETVDGGDPADPVIEFLRRWLWRNRPTGRDTAAFVAWDAGQFLHDGGQITALIDFELAHVGDPYMDLAPLRSRDTMEPFGDLRAVFDRYEQATGQPVDYDVVRYFEISQLAATLMLQRPVIRHPEAGTDLVTHMVWYVQSALYALDVLGELRGVEFEELAFIDAPVTVGDAAYEHLVRSLHDAARSHVDGDAPGGIDPQARHRRWSARCDYRLARHLRRVAHVGAAVQRAEAEDLTELLAGRHPTPVAVTTGSNTDAALLDLIHQWDETGEPGVEDDLMRYFHRRLQRESMLLGPPGSQLVQHIALQPFPGRRDNAGQWGSRKAGA